MELSNFDITQLKVTGFIIALDLYVPFGNSEKTQLEIAYKPDPEAMKSIHRAENTSWHTDAYYALVYETYEAAKAEVDRLLALKGEWVEVGLGYEEEEEEELELPEELARDMMEELNGETFRYRLRIEPQFDADSMPGMTLTHVPESRKKV